MKYTEEVYKRKRRGKTVYDGVLTYYDEDGTRRFKHCERKTRGDALEALRKLRQKLKTRIALNGEEGLSASLDKFNPPSVILVDLLLLGMTGFELCRRLRSEALTRTTPIVIVSARASDEEIASGAELGADDYIVKPFSIREVVGRINFLLQLKNKVTDAIPRGLTTINHTDS